MRDEHPPLEPVSSLPTADDKMAGDFQGIVRLMRQMRENVDEVMALRKAMYDGALKQGFTDDQALKIAMGPLLLT